MKMGMFAVAAQNEMDRTGTRDLEDPALRQRLTEIADSIENRAGLVTYDNYFMNRTYKDMMHIAARAFGFTRGSAAEFLTGPAMDVVNTPERLRTGDAVLSIRMASLIATVVGVAGMNALIMYLLTRRWPRQAKDYVYPETGRIRPDGSADRLKSPNYLNELYSWTSAPLDTIANKQHPLLSAAMQVLKNEDYYGRPVYNPNDPVEAQWHAFAEHAGRQFTPFAIESWDTMRHDGASKLEAALSTALGVQPAPAYVCRTPAQVLMQRLRLASMPPSIHHSPTDVDVGAMRQQLINRLRLAQPIDDIDYRPHFTRQQLANITRDATLPPFEDQFSKLKGMEDMLRVYAIATDEERGQVAGIVRNHWRNIVDGLQHGRVSTDRMAELRAMMQPLSDDISSRSGSSPALAPKKRIGQRVHSW